MACRLKRKKIIVPARSQFVITAVDARQIVAAVASKRINKTFSLEIRLDIPRKVIFMIANQAVFW